ncbi:UNVERIFIED_CONTAM: hypothetical protein GTU68_001290 [Idotea baltica]|nr:hypothetical protein [Idotea baltica]
MGPLPRLSLRSRSGRPIICQNLRTPPTSPMRCLPNPMSCLRHRKTR